MIDRGLTLSHIKLWITLVNDPSLTYDELAQRLERAKKTVRRLEDDLVEGGYMTVHTRRDGRSRRNVSLLREFRYHDERQRAS